MMATSSFDSVKLWHIDFNSQSEELKIQCSQTIDEQNITAVLILPGNKFVVLGTKTGLLMLYDI